MDEAHQGIHKVEISPANPLFCVTCVHLRAHLALELIETGFEFICDYNENKLFPKRK